MPCYLIIAPDGVQNKLYKLSSSNYYFYKIFKSELIHLIIFTLEKECLLE